MNIRTVATSEAPFELLTLADPSIERIQQHLVHGQLLVGYEPDYQQAIAAAIVNDYGDHLEISNIAVTPAQQGRGRGKQMIAFIIAFARQQGYSQLRVGTGNSSLEQLAFYQKCGFRIIGVIPDYFGDDDPTIFENGIRCQDMVLLAYSLTSIS